MNRYILSVAATCLFLVCSISASVLPITTSCVKNFKLVDSCNALNNYSLTEPKMNLMLLNDSVNICCNSKSASFVSFYNITDIGNLTAGSNKLSILTMGMVNGFRLCKRVGIGIGTGIEFYSSPYIPVFADLRITLFNSTISPFVFFQGGRLYATKSDPEQYGYYYNSSYTNRGGRMLCVGVGYTFRITNSFSLNTAIAYRNQILNSDYFDYQSQKVEKTEEYNRFVIRLGFCIQ